MLNYHPENGYTVSPASKLDTYPHRVISTGQALGDINLEVKVNDDSLDYYCGGPVHGFKVLVHSNDMYPNMLKQFQKLATKIEGTISIQPKITRAEPEIADYSADQ